MAWQAVIGLEVHTQLLTQSKIFSGAATAYGAEPNSQACIIDLGFPGVLPVLNEKAVQYAIKFGLAINAEIPHKNIFARKNYFYPDLPKGYQISQYEQPIVGRGHLDIQLEDGSTKRIGITRAHLEEDAGKSVHQDFHRQTGIDLNRAGTPLLEIVSEPEMHTAKEAVAYLKALHALVRYLGICDGNMQEGSFRCDANVSVRSHGTETLGTRAEIKNVNSFKFVERAINFEIDRQIHLLEHGETVVQETRLYDADNNETRSMRSKEEAHDYRYFPDPDLLPIIIEQETIAAIQKTLPELPDVKYQRYIDSLHLPAQDAYQLSMDPDMAVYFETLLEEGKVPPKIAANWITGELAARLNKDDLSIKDSPISAHSLGKLLQRIEDHTISGKIAKIVFDALWQGESDPDSIIQQRGLKQVTDTGAIAAIVDEVLAAHPEQVEQYRAGKEKVFGFLVGKVMQASKGKANPAQVNELLKTKLNG